MAHELDFKENGNAAMAYAGNKPWHGLGQHISADANLDTWAKEAGMEWEAKRSPVRFLPDDLETSNQQELIAFEGNDVIYRSDNKVPLSIVGSGYKIVQPRQMLDFFGNLIEHHGFKMETAGCLFGGRIFWALARIPNSSYALGQGDNIQPYALIATSVDGKMATSVQLTSVCVVCNNTLTMAIGKNGKRAIVRIPHNSIFDPRLAQLKAGLVEATTQDFYKYITELSTIKIDKELALDILVKSMKEEWKDKAGNKMSSKQVEESSAAVRRIMSYFDGGGIASHLPSRLGTAWGLVNAVTQYCDHDAGWKKNSKNEHGKSAVFCRTQGLITSTRSYADLFNLKVKITNNLLELV